MKTVWFLCRGRSEVFFSEGGDIHEAVIDYSCDWLQHYPVSE
jgi:hypothetical protein